MIQLKSLTFLKAATSVVSRQDAANFYQSRIIILTMCFLLKTATSVVSWQEESKKLKKKQNKKEPIRQSQIALLEIHLVKFHEDLSRAPYSRRTKEGGWLSDRHLDEWFELMWSFLPTDADRAIASSYLCGFVMRGDIPGWVCNGVTYPVMWADVEKVFFSINEPKKHYCLGVLHIRTGVITLYDSLYSEAVETRKWWIKIRKAFKKYIPPYLQERGILDAKGITLESYNINCHWKGCPQTRSFLRYMRPLIIIDEVHLKGNYLGTNLLVVGMDGNNHIIPLATDVSEGETGESWTWFLSKLKEQIGEPPNLCIISDRHAVIIQACEAPENDLCDWAAAKVYDRMLKSENYSVKPIDHLKLFQVFNKLEVHQVDLVAFQCSFRKWKLFELPYAHVCAVCRVSGLTNCNLWEKPWFKKTTQKSTYQEMVYPLKDPKMWQVPNDLQLVLPPVMIKRPAGRPKNKNCILSTNESATIPSRTREKHLSEEVRLGEERLRNGRVYMDWDYV
nr:hypothetical protein [Tanacetum cinerariifolium]